MIVSVANAARSRPYWLSSDRQQFAADLMHQQLYTIGRDIVAQRGNQLLNYGCEKLVSAVPHIPSIYIHRPHSDIEVGLRGFGVFIGAKSIGGIFIRRFDFKPRWMPGASMPRDLWLLRDLPAGKAPRSRADHRRIGQLVSQLCAWFSDYESTIKRQFGHRYRLGQLLHFRRLNATFVHTDQAAGWNRLREWLV